MCTTGPKNIRICCFLLHFLTCKLLLPSSDCDYPPNCPLHVHNGPVIETTTDPHLQFDISCSGSTNPTELSPNPPHYLTGLKYGTARWWKPLCVCVDTPCLRCSSTTARLAAHRKSKKTNAAYPKVNGAQPSSGGIVDSSLTSVALIEIYSLFSLQVCWWLPGFDSGCQVWGPSFFRLLVESSGI